MPSYKLTYFNLMGKAEVARLIMAYGEVEFEDRRLEFADWPAVKPSTPFGQVPQLTVDGIDICQTSAINTYLAKQVGLYGSTDMEAAQIDMMAGCVDDVAQCIQNIAHALDASKKPDMVKTFLDKLPTYLKDLDKLLKTNGGGDGYLVGKSVSYADLMFMQLFTWPAMIDLDPIDVSDYPKLTALKARVEAIPSIAAWRERRPVTKF